MEARYDRSGDYVVSNFLLKLISLLESPNYKKFVSWEKEGNSFVIYDQASFSKFVLPKYFKHNKFSSFVRQLNMYGFRKVPMTSSGGIASLTQECIQFFHPLFERGKFEKLPMIKRKVTQSTKAGSDEVAQVVEEVQEMKTQNTRNTISISDLKRQNSELWKEVASLRKKQKQNQRVVQNLIKFLVRLVTPSVNMKRRPLMIDDGGLPPKIMKTDGGESTELPQSLTNIEIIQSDDNGQSSSSGPLITELLTSALDYAGGSSSPQNILSPENFDINSLLTNSSETSKLLHVTSPIPQVVNPPTPAPPRMIKLALPTLQLQNHPNFTSNNATKLNVNKQLVLAAAAAGANNATSLNDTPMWSVNSLDSSQNDFVSDLQHKLSEGHLVIEKNLFNSNVPIDNLVDSLPPSITQNLQNSVSEQDEDAESKAVMNYNAAQTADNSSLAFLDQDIDVGQYSDYFDLM